MDFCAPNQQAGVMKAVALVVLAGLTLHPASAAAQHVDGSSSAETSAPATYEPVERPPSGAGFVLAGGLLGALAGGSYLGALACIGRSGETECLAATVTLGSTFFVASIPLIVVGLRQNAELKRWREAEVEIAPQRGGGTLGLRLRF